MFRSKDEIGRLIELFVYRNVYLFHACQFKDFQSYLSLGGIPSRDILEKQRLTYTLFESDDNDKLNEVWDKVFINLEDYGKTFASGGNAVPNPYGPIVFKIRPESLNDAEEVAITLRSAGAEDFNRWDETLTSIDDVNRVFLYPIHAKGHDLAKVRFRDSLYEAFPNRPPKKVRSTEAHCILPNGLLSLEYVEEVIVDPYIIREKRLINWVNEERAKHRNLPVTLSIRQFMRRDSLNRNVYNELAEIIVNISPSFGALNRHGSPVLRNWAQNISNIDLKWQYERFARYLLEGTLMPLLENEADLHLQE